MTELLYISETKKMKINYSICFDCANAYAHRCQKIFEGTPIEGWTAQELDGGGYMVLQCPNFIKDWDHRVNAKKIGEMLKLSERTVQRMNAQKLIARVREKGYQLKIHVDKTYRNYYIYKI